MQNILHIIELQTPQRRARRLSETNCLVLVGYVSYSVLYFSDLVWLNDTLAFLPCFSWEESEPSALQEQTDTNKARCCSHHVDVWLVVELELFKEGGENALPLLSPCARTLHLVTLVLSIKKKYNYINFCAECISSVLIDMWLS